MNTNKAKLVIQGIDHFELTDIREALDTMYYHAESKGDALCLEVAIKGLNEILCRVRQERAGEVD